MVNCPAGNILNLGAPMNNNDSNPDDFQVVDKRKVTQEGGLREEAVPKGGDRDPAPPDAAQVENTPDGPPSADFTFILNNLAMPAVAFLGDIPDPATGKTQLNLPVAKLFIDSLVVLREKTRGNLTAEEERLLDGLLANLQLRFVEKSGSGITLS